ncbi:MAG: metal-dependent hydrolase [Bdellovibrionales bacterium]|nr:metal-dependent hydrolase [Bdellovibrionales bacterium]
MSIESITFAGHSAVFLNAGDSVIAIDPWLEGNPSCPNELKSPKRIDLIVLTHGHADHASEAVHLAKQYGSKIAATYELAVLMQQEGVAPEQTFPMNKGGTISWNGFTVTLTNAFHSSSYDTAKGTVYAGEACGVIIGDGSRHIYHAGDTCLFEDMALIQKRYQPEIALLPIGDRFTMGPEEAAQAAKLIGCKLAIPIHYKTFDLLTGTAEEFSKACGALSIETLALEPGQTHSL